MTKMAITINGCEPANLYPALILGSAGVSLGYEVVLFFTPGASPALKKGFLEGIEKKGMPPLGELVECFTELGGKLFLCELAIEAAGIDRGELRDGVRIGGATGFMSEIKDATITFSF